MWTLYLIRKGEKIYTGITTSLENRLRQHSNPALLHTETFSDKFAAAKREKQIKGWSHSKKLKLIEKILSK